MNIEKLAKAVFALLQKNEAAKAELRRIGSANLENPNVQKCVETMLQCNGQASGICYAASLLLSESEIEQFIVAANMPKFAFLSFVRNVEEYTL